jgi:DNA-directed RNA polymerase specialized sigma24 family protein
MRPVTQEEERTGSGVRPGPYELYEAERGPLMWYLRAQGVGEHEAEDAIQAAFVRLLQAKVAIREPRAWLRTVTCPGPPSSWRSSAPSCPRDSLRSTG